MIHLTCAVAICLAIWPINLGAKDQPDLSPSVVAVRGCENWGFFAEFLWVLNHIHWCVKTHHIPYVYWGPSLAYYSPAGYNGSKNAWEYYFKQVSDVTFPGVESPIYMNRVHDNEFTTIWDYTQYVYHFGLLPPNGKALCEIINLHPKVYFGNTTTYPVPFGNKHLYDPQFRKYVKESLLDPYIVIQPNIKEKIDKFYGEKMAMKKTIGIHLRGSFLGNEVHSVPLESICQEAKRISNNEYQFFIATDQKPLLEKAKKLLNGNVIYYKYPESNSTTSPQKPQQLKPWHGEDVLIEAILLSKCDYLVHTLSQVSTSVLYFNPDLPHTVLY